MRILLFLSILLLAGIQSSAQKYYTGKKPSIRFTSFSGDKMKEDDADLLIAITKVNDTSYRRDQYTASGPLQISQYFKTSEMDQPHGQTVLYKKNGLADQSGFYLNGKKEGEWLLVNDSGRMYKKQLFAKGKLISTEEIPVTSPDSAVTNEIESSFTGGISAWISYLQNNLSYPKKAIKQEITGKVMVIFMVETDGSIHAPSLYRSVNYYIDMEAVRLIESSPNWTPAIKGTEKVRSYKIQPITFMLSD